LSGTLENFTVPAGSAVGRGRLSGKSFFATRCEKSRMKKKIAIIGASYLQLPLVLKAKEMGLETICFAWMEADDV
jgi:hypothetical protein